MPQKLFRLEVYVPETHLEQVKQALFSAGAGKLGNYDCCAFQSRGRGQFRPLPGARPFLGSSGTLEQVEEWKLELVLQEDCLAGAIAALKAAHPYETPAYQYWPVQS
ncbi:MAG: NGG1p interacting factor NIF3 [Oligosphaeraceae bacterium]|nr:NGG1p interacting factor NIF3 [Oligosphaeraceae bacterium]